MLVELIMSVREDIHLFEVEMTSALCDVIGSPVASHVKTLISQGKWRELVDYEVDPNDYDDAGQFADDYLVTTVLNKSHTLPLDVDREKECEALFRKCESANAATNSRLYGAVHPDWFYTVQNEFRTILGKLTKSNLDRIVSLMRFSGGVNVGVNGDGLVPSIKFDSEMSLTHSLVPFSRTLMGEIWWEHQRSPRTVVRGNEFFTVPKSAKAYRGCCKEPLLNMFGQLGIGDYLSERLRFFGVDIRDQSKNQRLVSKAWEKGLATIDLSSASDTLTRSCVHELATNEWSHLLGLFRSPFTKIGGEWIELQMFSSMGNGFTFPLETAVFLAVVRSVVPHEHRVDCAVYGDDMIVPQTFAADVIDRLEYLGFQVNKSKTCLAGSFYESCGHDYFKTVNVRPFYLRLDPEDRTQVPYFLQTANALRIYASRRGCGEFCDARFEPIWARLERNLGAFWRRTSVPNSYGNLGLIRDPTDAGWRGQRPSNKGKLAQNEGFVAHYVKSCPIKADRKTLGVVLAAYTGGSPETTKGLEPMRGYLGRPVPRKSVTPWHSGFGWL